MKGECAIILNFEKKLNFTLKLKVKNKKVCDSFPSKYLLFNIIYIVRILSKLKYLDFLQAFRVIRNEM